MKWVKKISIGKWILNMGENTKWGWLVVWFVVVWVILLARNKPVHLWK